MATKSVGSNINISISQGPSNIKYIPANIMCSKYITKEIIKMNFFIFKSLEYLGIHDNRTNNVKITIEIVINNIVIVSKFRNVIVVPPK